MQNNITPQGVAGDGHCWAAYAEAQLLAAEGSRLMSQEIAAGIRALWHRVMRSLNDGQRPHCPPI
jgi:hypothetical protein